MDYLPNSDVSNYKYNIEEFYWSKCSVKDFQVAFSPRIFPSLFQKSLTVLLIEYVLHNYLTF